MNIDIPLIILRSLSIILALGIIASIFAKKLKISNFLFLIIFGLILQNYKELLYGISQEFIIVVSTLTLIITVFEGSSHLKIKRVNDYSVKVLKFIISCITVNLFILPFLIIFIFKDSFNFINILIASIFSIIIIATDPTTLFKITKHKTNKTINFLEIESILNTPLIVIIPLMLINILSEPKILLDTSSIISSNLTIFSLQITAGIGTGIIFGFFLFRGIRKFYSKNLSSLTIITVAIICYIIAESIGGSGIMALATMGILFGNVKIIKKSDVESHNSMLTSSLIILVFIFLGFLININLNLEFIWKSLIIFIVALLLRTIVISFVLRGESFSLKEKIFIGLNMPKGVAAAVVILSLSFITQSFTKLFIYDIVLQLSAISIFYSIIVSTIVCKYEKFFLSKTIIQNEIDDDSIETNIISDIKSVRNKNLNQKKDQNKKKKDKEKN